MDRISESSVAQLMEVMWEVLPSSPGAAEVLLNEIFRDQQTHSLREVRAALCGLYYISCSFDDVIILMCNSPVAPTKVKVLI
jgi:hypothetical protein